ncbi:MAG TPA: XRE family transcriptional regulator [Allosphingosinicella sp.]|jgi:hypothetical protein
MRYSDFLTELHGSDLTVRAFAQIVGRNPNSVSNYAQKGEVPDHLALIAVLIGELWRHGIDYGATLDRVNPVRKKPRGRARTGRFGGDPQEVLDLES